MRKTGRNAAADNQCKLSSRGLRYGFFMGSGQQTKAALALGRRTIGVKLKTERFEQTMDEIITLIDN